MPFNTKAFPFQGETMSSNTNASPFPGKKLKWWQHIYIWNYRFWHLFTYRSYVKYLKAKRLEWRWFKLAIILLCLMVLGNRALIMVSCTVVYLWVLYIIVLNLRARPLKKVNAKLQSQFQIKQDGIEIFDYQPYDMKQHIAKIVFNLYTERSILGSLIHKINHNRQVSRNYRLIGMKLYQIIKFYLHNPNNHDRLRQYYFYITLPLDEAGHVMQPIANAFKQAQLTLMPQPNIPKCEPTPITQFSNFTSVPKKWQIFQIQIKH